MAFQTLDLSGREAARPGFWARFGTGPTPGQRTFDWIFGVIMPVACFFFDPFIFTSHWDSSLLGSVRPFAYILSYVSIVAMIGWLLLGERLKWLNALLAGLFAVGAIISFALGLILFPLSLFGLLLVVGLLGFTPLFSAWVYLRNAVWAFRAAGPFLERRVVINSLMLAAVLSVTVPWTVNAYIKREFDRIASGNAGEIRAAAARLRYVKPLIDASPIANQYHNRLTSEKAPERKQALAKAYKDLTGKDIENARWMVD